MVVAHAALVTPNPEPCRVSPLRNPCTAQAKYTNHKMPPSLSPQNPKEYQEGSPFPGLGPSSISSKLINLPLIRGLSSASSLCPCPSSLSPDFIGVRALLCLGTDPNGLLVSNPNGSPGVWGKGPLEMLGRRRRVSVENECVLETVIERGGVERAGE